MSAATANAAPTGRRLSLAWAARQRVVMALVLLILFGALRYEHFLGAYNVLSVLRYNSMFALTSLGMCFVIMMAGIDLSVGTTAACASVVSAMLSPYGLIPGLVGGLGIVPGGGLLAKRSYLEPGTGGDHQQFQGVGIELAGIAAIGVNQRRHFIFEREWQHEHLFVGRAAELLHESSSHLGDVAGGCNAILVGVGDWSGIQVERKILDDVVVAEAAGLPS